MNTRAKSSRKERQCLKELLSYLKKNGEEILIIWHAVKTRNGSNAYLSIWTLAILSKKKHRKTQWLVCVKSHYVSNDIKRYIKLSFGNCYLAIYGKSKPRDKQIAIELPHFWLIEVT